MGNIDSLKTQFTTTLERRINVLKTNETYAKVLSEDSFAKTDFTDFNTFAFYVISGLIPASYDTLDTILENATEDDVKRLIKVLNGGTKFMDFKDGISLEDLEDRQGSENPVDLINYDLDKDGDIDADDIEIFSDVEVVTTPTNINPTTPNEVDPIVQTSANEIDPELEDPGTEIIQTSVNEVDPEVEDPGTE